MKKEVDEGAAEFCKMLAVYISKLKDSRIVYFSQPWNGGIRMVFRSDLYQLFTLYLSEGERKILLFSDLKKMYPVFHSELRNLFSFLEFVIEDKSK
jgi:hypothetical protein